jgi:hypothetical protein
VLRPAVLNYFSGGSRLKRPQSVSPCLPSSTAKYAHPLQMRTLTQPVSASTPPVGAIVGPRRSCDKAAGDEDGGPDESDCEQKHQHVSCTLCIATIVCTGPKPKISPESGRGGHHKDRAERRADGPNHPQSTSFGSTPRHARSFAREPLGGSSRAVGCGLCRTSAIRHVRKFHRPHSGTGCACVQTARGTRRNCPPPASTCVVTASPKLRAV